MDRLLLNPPTITRMEVAVVCVAAMFLCIAPLMLAWAEARRRRRLARQIEAPILSPLGTVEPIVVVPRAEFAEPVSEWPLEAPTSSPAIDMESVETEAAILFATTELFLAEAPEPPPVAAAAATLSADDSEPLPVPVQPESAAQPAFRFQLLELRQARLADWPPLSVRANAESHRVWQEAERLAATYDRRISTTPLECSRAVQATTLGTAETDGNLYRLHFFLFDDLWPDAATQAVAEAVFDIDPHSGPTRAWVLLR